MNIDFSNSLMKCLIELAGTILVSLSCISVRYLISWLKSKTENEILKNSLDELDEAIETGIWFVEQTSVKTYKETNNWNAHTQELVLKECIEYVNSRLSDRTLGYLNKNQETINQQIEAAIESRLGQLHYLEKRG